MGSLSNHRKGLPTPQKSLKEQVFAVSGDAVLKFRALISVSFLLVSQGLFDFPRKKELPPSGFCWQRGGGHAEVAVGHCMTNPKSRGLVVWGFEPLVLVGGTWETSLRTKPPIRAIN